MFCQKCGRALAMDSGACKYCTEALPPANAGVLKTSTILISADRTEAVFRSIHEVPENLRKKLLDSTNSLNAATILIADRRGKEEISKAIRKLPVSNQRRLLQSIMDGDSGGSACKSVFNLSVPQIAGMLLAGMGGVLVWLLLFHTW
jgi:hypothetical protein